MSEFLRRLSYLWNRRRLDRELADDMEFHREMAARDGGIPLGNALQLREESRDAWGWTWIDRLAQDLRYAFRQLRKSPGFTLAAILMLGIGIGVNVAAFGFFDLIILRPLPVRDPATLLRFHRRAPQSYAFALPYPEMSFFREHSRTLSTVLALNIAKLSMQGEEKPLIAHFVSTNFFSELGAAPLLGRMLDPARDDEPAAEPVVVLAHGFWQRRFGADPSVIGKVIHLNGQPVTVIGVAPREFSSLSLNMPDVWAPISRQPRLVPGSKLLTDFSLASSSVAMWGRVRPGLTPKAAEEELKSLAAQLHNSHPADIWEKESIPSEPGGYAGSLTIGNRRGTGVEERDPLYLAFALLGALALLILAVACGNLGSLLLARGVAREREISIRISVGAGRVRLIRQLFTESLVLALLGSAAGLALGYVVLRGLMALAAVPEWLNPAPDWRVVAFAAGTGFVAAIFFGLAPALQAARQRYRASFMRQFLVAAQVAASCVLLIVAGLLVRALNHAMFTNPGFEYEQVFLVNPALGAHGYTPAKARAYLDALQGRLRGIPGVESVSLALFPPLGNGSMTAGMEIEGHALDVQVNRIDPPFFRTMGIPLLSGRNLTPTDRHAVIVSHSFAMRAWPGQNPLGKQLPNGDVVVGIAGSARAKLEDPEMVELYSAATMDDLPALTLVVKTVSPPEDVARAAASLANSIDPIVFPEIQLLKTAYHRRVQSVEAGALAISLLGSIAQLLACLGIAGVVAYAVSQRTKEIGIRMALGAKPSHVVTIVMRQFSLPVAAGLVVGIGGAVALSQVLRRHLYGVSNLDPLAYVAAIAVFAITVALAAWLPAKRAARIDPLRALRYE